MPFLTQVLGNALGVASRVSSLQVADRDPRKLSDLGFAGDEASRARSSEPGSSQAGRSGVNGR